MNPKMTITIGERGKTYVKSEGLVSVGAKVDVEVRGLNPNDMPDWESGDEYVGKALRFRLVSASGDDMVVFPLKKKGTGTTGDQWTVVESSFCAYGVDFNTNVLREKMDGIPYNEGIEAGVIVDSVKDAAEYGVGGFYVRQWKKASADAPSVIPDWTSNMARKPTTGALGADVDLDAVVTKVNTLISQLKGGQ